MRKASWLAIFLLSTAAADDFTPRRDAAERARAQVREKLDASDRGLRARVRALYKLSAFGDLPHWVGKDAVDGTLHRRGAARRVILRDLEERRLLRDELAAIDADLDRIDREAARARELASPRPREGSLLPPVSGRIVGAFGPYDDPHTHVRLLRRGVELAAPDPTVLAAATGEVVFVGPARGLGTIVVLDHAQDLVTVTSGLAVATVSRGDLVPAGAPIGMAAAGRVGFEIRRAGRPLDPQPLLRAGHRR